uniref:Glyco_transf_64 domain-containing protein n=1 Tax=Macrostomum lignano TaxID=282301 RepID=A0A1I8FGY7_9PLAT
RTASPADPATAISSRPATASFLPPSTPSSPRRTASPPQVRVFARMTRMLLPARTSPVRIGLAVFALGLVLTVPLLLLTTSWRRGSHVGDTDSELTGLSSFWHLGDASRKFADKPAEFRQPFVYAPLDTEFIDSNFDRLKLALSRSPAMGKYQAHVDVLMTERRPQINTDGWRFHTPSGRNLTLAGLQAETYDRNYTTPNLAHFILPFQDPQLAFHHFVCILSGFWVMRPQKLVLWYAKPPSGHYWELLKTNITAPVWEQRIVMIQRPVTQKIYNMTVKVKEHQADVMRIEAVLGARWGLPGPGRDHPERPWSRFENTSSPSARSCPQSLCNGVFSGAPNKHRAGALAPLLPDLRRRLLGRPLAVRDRRHLQALSRPTATLKRTRWTGRAWINFGKMYGEGDRTWDWQTKNYAMHLFYGCYGVQHDLKSIRNRQQHPGRHVSLHLVRQERALQELMDCTASPSCFLCNFIPKQDAEASELHKKAKKSSRGNPGAAKSCFKLAKKIARYRLQTGECRISALLVRYLTKRFIETYMSGNDVVYKHQAQLQDSCIEVDILDSSAYEPPAISTIDSAADFRACRPARTGRTASWPSMDVTMLDSEPRTRLFLELARSVAARPAAAHCAGGQQDGTSPTRARVTRRTLEILGSQFHCRHFLVSATDDTKIIDLVFNGAVAEAQMASQWRRKSSWNGGKQAAIEFGDWTVGAYVIWDRAVPRSAVGLRHTALSRSAICSPPEAAAGLRYLEEVAEAVSISIKHQHQPSASASDQHQISISISIILHQISISIRIRSHQIRSEDQHQISIRSASIHASDHSIRADQSASASASASDQHQISIRSASEHQHQISISRSASDQSASDQISIRSADQHQISIRSASASILQHHQHQQISISISIRFRSASASDQHPILHQDQQSDQHQSASDQHQI